MFIIILRLLYLTGLSSSNSPSHLFWSNLKTEIAGRYRDQHGPIVRVCWHQFQAEPEDGVFANGWASEVVGRDAVDTRSVKGCLLVYLLKVFKTTQTIFLLINPSTHATNPMHRGVMVYTVHRYDIPWERGLQYSALRLYNVRTQWLADIGKVRPFDNLLRSAHL